MRRVSVLCLMGIFLLFTWKAEAQDVVAGEVAGSGKLVLGAQLGFGLEWSARNNDLKDSMDAGFVFGGAGQDVKNSAGFSAGGWVYADYYVLDILALEGGLGFVGKGAHFKYTVAGGALFGDIDGDYWVKLAYMEIPLGVKLNFANFRISALLLLNIALTGKYRAKIDNNSSDEKFNDNAWDFWRRFNLGLRLAAGYAIPIGPIVLVPGIDWSTHFINEIKDDNVGDIGVRWMNFFFNVAVEFRLPI